MDKRGLIITASVLGGIALIGGVWYGISYYNSRCPKGSKKDKDGNCVLETGEEILTEENNNSGGNTGGGSGTQTDYGSGTQAGGTKPTKKFSNFKIGENLFAYSNPTNMYTKPTASSATLYKWFKPNYFVGTYLGVSGEYYKVAIEEKGTLGFMEGKEMYVRKGSVSSAA